MYYLENDLCKVSIHPKGAELHSIFYKNNEYLWCANPTFWSRHAPVLFPFIGRLKEQSYTVEGKTYQISAHGFARDMEFQAHQVSNTCIEFSLCDSLETRNCYPYQFVFTIRYTLEQNRLIRNFTIENKSDIPLYYELGGHDAYALDLQEANLEDYYIEFENTEALESFVCTQQGLITQQKNTIAFENGRLYLSKNLLCNTFMFENVPNHRCTLGCTKHDRKISVSFEDFRYLALWSQFHQEQPVPFVCIEPWSALPDCTFIDDKIENKLGIRKISPSQTDQLELTITLY